jgi:hypothetical protein
MGACNRQIIFVIWASLLVVGNAQAVRIPVLTTDETVAETTVKFAPIPVNPKAYTQHDFLKRELAWRQRQWVAPFQQRTAGQPWWNAATNFVAQALELTLFPTSTSLAATNVATVGAQLLKAGCQDPLVLFLQGQVLYRADGTKWRDGLKLLEDALPQVASNRAVDRALGYWIVRRCIVFWVEAGYQHLPKHDRLLMDYIQQTIQAGCYRDYMDLFVEHHIVQVDYFEFNKPMLEQLARCYDKPSLPEWARRTLLGHTEIQLAWADRGGGWAGTVTEQGWEGFGGYLKKARANLVAAWQLQPDQPMAAAEMIRVIMGGGGEEGDNAWVWFERAVSAQFDYNLAYGHMLYLLRPRWGGSHEAMLAFGKACVATRRFDTEVPWNLLRACELIDEDVPDLLPILRRPDIAPLLVEYGRGTLESPAYAAQRTYRLSCYAIYAWAAGDYALAAQVLQRVGEKLHFAAGVRLRKNFHSSESTLRSEVAIYTSPARSAFEKAEALRAEGQTTAARAAYAAALDKANHPLAQAAIAGRISALDIEQQLTKGDWVKLIADPKLAHWSLCGGAWLSNTGGPIVNLGEDATGIILHRARIGLNFELRGEFEIKSKRQFGQNIGIAIGWNNRTKDGWTLCRIGQLNGEPCTACLIEGNHSKPVVTGETFKLQPVNRFLLRCFEGLVSLEVNSQQVLKDAPLPVGAPDGLLGIAGLKWRNGNTSTVRNLEVRQLAPMPN